MPSDRELIDRVRTRYDMSATGTLRLLVLFTLASDHPRIESSELLERRKHAMAELEYTPIPVLDAAQPTSLQNVDWEEVMAAIRVADSMFDTRGSRV